MGGIVQFNIPENWVEKYEKNGGGEFYLDSPDSGTLRLNVITLEKPENQELNNQVLLEFSNDYISHSGVKTSSRQINDRVAIAQYDQAFVDRGQNIIIRFWIIANLVPPKNIRIATFSYTLLELRFNQPEFIEELAMLNSEIGNSKFSVINNKTNQKPWWCFGK